MPAGHRQRSGFSLVELLIAQTLTLVLLAGIGRVFIATGHSQRLQDSLARMQENARYVLETLATDLRRAGYWGGITDVQRIEDHTPAGIGQGLRVAGDDGTCTDRNWARMLGSGIYGKDDTRRGYACLPAGHAPAGDVLVVRYMAPWSVGSQTSPVFEPQQFYLRSSVFAGKLFLGADQAAHPVTGSPVRVAEVVARAYYIHTPAGASAGCARSGVIPSLYRTTLVNGRPVAAEVARGVEQLQLQYGIDSDADGAVDHYLDAPPAGNTLAWRRVIAVRVWILLRAGCPETGYIDRNSYRLGNISLTPADAYRRQLYVQTVSLRNRVMPP